MSAPGHWPMRGEGSRATPAEQYALSELYPLPERLPDDLRRLIARFAERGGQRG